MRFSTSYSTGVKLVLATASLVVLAACGSDDDNRMPMAGAFVTLPTAPPPTDAQVAASDTNATAASATASAVVVATAENTEPNEVDSVTLAAADNSEPADI